MSTTSTIELALRPEPEPEQGTSEPSTGAKLPSAPQEPFEFQSIEAQDAATSKGKTAAIITCITCSTGISAFLSGSVIVGLPTIIKDLSINPGLALWPVSVAHLVCGCTLLLCGSVADVVGARRMWVTGCILQAIFTMCCGLASVSKSSTQLIVFRALGGLSASFCLPSAVSVINQTFPPGPRRNIAFASMGGGQPVGFGLGLTIGGVVTAKLGWQWGFYMTATIGLFVAAYSAWQLPQSQQKLDRSVWIKLRTEIDWVGVCIASSSLAMISYVMAAVSKDAAGIRNPGIIVMLTLSLLLMPAFPLWMRRQERLRRPTLIPNSLWGNTIFTCICLNVFLSTASFDATEQLTNLFFQNLQGLSPLQAAVRLIPMPISGIIVNSAMGLVVHRLRADWLVTGCIALTCASPLVLALMQPDWNYWPAGFFIVFLAPMGVDSLYTVSNLLISSMFPKKTQALAGGVFNTLSQIGQSFGIALLAAISNNVKNGSGDKDKDAKAALLQGYSASSWFFFALCATSLLMSVFGLRRIGKVGKKED